MNYWTPEYTRQVLVVGWTIWFFGVVFAVVLLIGLVKLIKEKFNE